MLFPRRPVEKHDAPPPSAKLRAFPKEGERHVFPRAGAEKAFSITHHPCRSGLGGQAGAAACSLREIPRWFRQPRESPSARASPVAGTHWIAFPRLGAASSRLPLLLEHCPGISRA